MRTIILHYTPPPLKEDKKGYLLQISLFYESLRWLMCPSWVTMSTLTLVEQVGY